jgi:hypothetical protein
MLMHVVAAMPSTFMPLLVAAMMHVLVFQLALVVLVALEYA